MILTLISFFAGVLTVLSPCVLPLLPVIVGGSLAGGTSFIRSSRVIIALGLSVFIFTLLLKATTIFIAVPPGVWNWISGTILFSVGIFFLFPHLWDLLPGTIRANRESTRLMSSGFMQQSIWGDLLVGAALGPVFSTCSPTYFVVLATVLPTSLLGGIVDILAYIIGLCLFLLLVTVLGQKFIERLNPTLESAGLFRRGIGILFLLIGVLVVTNTLALVEGPLYNVFDETKLEQYLLQKNTGNNNALQTRNIPSSNSISSSTSLIIQSKPKPMHYLTLAQKATMYDQAPELISPDAYLNTDGSSVTLSQYVGKKVVLVDFWTYSCINCLRTLPYLKAWYAKYKDQGLVIVGVHTPEFAFEHLESNVTDALIRLGIIYPVVLDNEYRTWSAFKNNFWPHEYLIDIDGFIVHDQVGEGDYDQTETAIQTALEERAARLKTSASIATSTVQVMPQPSAQSPETYFGSNRNEYLGNGTPGQLGIQKFIAPMSVNLNTLYLGGSWDIEPEYARPIDADASISYKYVAKDVYLVASGVPSGTDIEILEDGQPIQPDVSGKDVTSGVLRIKESRLYHIVTNRELGEHMLTLIVKTPGLQAYTFTFG